MVILYVFWFTANLIGDFVRLLSAGIVLRNVTAEVVKAGSKR
jgi:hypothetical protein